MIPWAPVVAANFPNWLSAWRAGPWVRRQHNLRTGQGCEAMEEAQLLVVPLSGGVGLSAEQASLSEAGYDALGLAVPDDFGRPGAGIQLLLSAEDSFALVTVAAVQNGSAASIALA